MRRAAAETGAVLVGDGSAVPGDAAHYADHVHMTDAGLAVLADRVIKVISKTPGLMS